MTAPLPDAIVLCFETMSTFSFLTQSLRSASFGKEFLLLTAVVVESNVFVMVRYCDVYYVMQALPIS